jgi:uncharacterized damage-inducible protein DinB
MATILVELYRHNRWANVRLLDRCGELSAEQLDLSAPGTYGRVRDTLVHIVGAEQRYVARLSGREPERPVQSDEPFPGIAVLREQAERTGELLIAFAEENPPDKVTSFSDGGLTYHLGPVVPMVQAINHATEHRAHVVTILTQHGIEVPVIDGWEFGFRTGLYQVSG